MQRRSALKNLAVALGGLVSLPTWASGWTPGSLGTLPLLPADAESLLAEIVETIIPETSTPGAKSLKVHQFAMRMIADCLGEPATAVLQQGLTLTDAVAQQTYAMPYTSCDTTQRTDVLNRMVTAADPAAGQFVELIKNLTIRGYLNSEYVLVNLQKYTMAPGFYHGCVPLNK